MPRRLMTAWGPGPCPPWFGDASKAGSSASAWAMGPGLAVCNSSTLTTVTGVGMSLPLAITREPVTTTSSVRWFAA